jgi:plasmid stabilization system protein ParE
MEWYSNRSPVVAVEFRVMISDVVRRIAQSPTHWPKYLYGTRRFVVDRFSFFIVYLNDPGMLNIVAIAHSKRKPGYWKRRVQHLGSC